MGAARRLLAAADAERRSIERALHDGIQQDLIALSVRLQVLERAVRADPEAAPALVAETREDVRAALEEVRGLAGSIYPPLLADRGLAEALRALGLRVDDDGAARAPEALEAAAYFCCRDVRPRRVRLCVDDGTMLRLELEGATGDVGAARDRAEAFGGSISAGVLLELTLPRPQGRG